MREPTLWKERKLDARCDPDDSGLSKGAGTHGPAPEWQYVRLRPIRPDDATGLMGLYDRLSFDTAVNRFFTRMNGLPSASAYFFANVDYQDLSQSHHSRKSTVWPPDGVLAKDSR